MPQIINTDTTLSITVIAEQKAKAIAVFQALVDGINGELGDVTSFVIKGKTYPKADLVATFVKRIDAGKTTLGARTAMHLAVSEEHAITAEALDLRASIKSLLEMRYGKRSPMLQKFGYAQRKTTQKAAVTTANAVTKGKATRAARGTTGKKAKSVINIKAVPETAPPRTTTQPAPAAPAPVVTKPVASP